MRQLFSLMAGATLVAVLSQHAGAQSYPDRPITMIVPFSAGGGTDAIARKLADHLSTTLGQQVIIENKPGAATMIGAEYVKNAAPDGYTILMGSTSTFALAPYSYKNARYSFEDFTAVAGIIDYSHAFVARADAPFDDFAGMVTYAKENPGRLRFGTTGRGGVVHLQQQEIDSRLDIQTVDVSYQGGAPALQDILGGRLDVYLDGILPVAQHYKAGNVKVIALSGKDPVPAMEGVPTLAQAGFPQLTHDLWITTAAPKDTPRDVVVALNAAFEKALADKGIQQWMIELGYVLAYTSPEDEDTKIRTDAEKWRALITEFGIMLE